MSIRECVRCSAQTKKGARCKRTTYMYSKFCNAHAKQLFGLYLKNSSMPDSGKGLFTAKDISPQTRIAKHTGAIKTQAENRADPSGYAVATPRGKVVDAASTQSGIARYTNDCRAANKRLNQCKGNNAKFTISTRGGVTSVWLTSTKRIPAGSEIFVSCGGRGYWG